MITESDLNPHGFKMTSVQEHNLVDLAERLTKLETAFHKAPGAFLWVITSGLRSLSDHYRIYRAKGIENPPLGSAHLVGMACDISDPSKILQEWLLGDGLKHLEELGLYCEDFSKCKNWIHFQSRVPGSGNRFFMP